MTAPDFSAVALCSRAFEACEHVPFEDFADGSPEAAAAQRHWHPARRHVLAAAPWRFAEAFATAAAAIDAPAPAATPFVVQLEPDCLFFRGVDVDRPHVAVPMADRRLRTDVAPPFTYAYTADVIEPFRFSPAFAEALTLYLAHLFAPRFARSQTTAERLLRRYQLALDEAAVTDARHGTAPLDHAGYGAGWADAGQVAP